MEKYKNMTLEQLESLQEDSTNDEEIDEDMAFNSDDEEKYGKYFKKLSGGKISSNPSYKMEIEYERSEDGSSWLDSSYKDY